jgi:hypothetical protein
MNVNRLRSGCQYLQQQIWQYFQQNGEPRTTQKRDRDGNVYYQVYDPELKIRQLLALNQKFAGGSNNTIHDDLSSEVTRKIKNQIIPFLSTIH